MTGSIALDVVIGLVFIYLLYGLLGTLIAEIIATNLSLRAKNLKEAVDRMLNDEKNLSFFGRFWNSIKYIFSAPDNPIIDNFYNQQDIKYLGSKGLAKIPSYFKAQSFSRALLHLLKKSGTGADTLAQIKDALEKAKNDETAGRNIMGTETAEYVADMLEECQGDLQKFRLRLEQWFDNTMEPVSEWYKRKIQVILLFIGLAIAWLFNVDTFVIVHKLSTDSEARDRMIELTSAYLQNNSFQNIETVINDTTVKVYDARLDTLFYLQTELQKDVDNTQTILGLGSWLPDNMELAKVRDQKVYPEWVDQEIAPDGTVIDETEKSVAVGFTLGNKLSYLFRLLLKHFFGYLLTALAISLGAPFWFDLLNKLMKLRGVVKKELKDVTPDVTELEVSPLNRKG